MKRIGSIAVWIACMASLGVSSPALAQVGAPDMRDIFPYLMLVVDTSGSMERKPGCVCADLACVDCLPTCNPATGAPEKNRWATTLEALTGSFNNFSCEPLTRSVDNGATYDVGYYLPYHQPWDCSGQSPFTDCAFDSELPDGTPITTRDQNDNGILDEYKGRVNFGLMTFDGIDTYVGSDRLIPVAQFNTTLSEDVQGLWSYGGGKTFHYPNCVTDYMMDTGARSSIAEEGSLISLNSCFGTPGSPTCPSWCTSCWANDPTEITNQLNEDIQEALLSTRPYGGTPIAASLDDLYYHFKNDLTDEFAGCRNRFALLMTDGEPDKDYRDLGCDCDVGTDPNRCGPPATNDPAQMHCPYPTAEDVAFDLVHGRGTGDTAAIERLFVVGLDVGGDPTIVQGLNKIARAGCTLGAACQDPVTMNEALFANDLDTLVGSLSRIITQFLDPISRSVPIVVGANAGTVEQYQVATGFDVPPDGPWTGVIERQRYTCNTTTHLPEAQPITTADRLSDAVRLQANPTLITVLPDGTASANGALYGAVTGTPCGAPSGSDPTGCGIVALSDASVDTNFFGLGAPSVATNTRRQEILDWMYGASGTPRFNQKLGDIYHSSPVLLGRPQFDTVDDAFNEFRQRDVVANRPPTLFVNTNDGMIRAISLEPYVAPGGASVYQTNYPTPGHQFWGFVPPILLDDLEDSLTDHRIMMDGTVVLKDVYFNRTRGGLAGINADQYHSVLITGMRGGGPGPTNAYVALDVTNPTAPKFLWQFTDPAMGQTYAQPAIAQAIYEFDPGTGTTVTKNGAVAILAGGVGETGASGVSGDCTNNITNPSMRTESNRPFVTVESPLSAATANHRSDLRCWRDYGRALFFVDVETGVLIKKIHATSSGARVFPSPLVSTPAVFPGEVGTLASQVYVTDADGVIWRVDLTATDPEPDDPMAGWTARPFHDVFWDRSPTAGEVSYDAPILSVDDKGRPVVIVATGDNDNFNKTTVENRVVSMTEVIDTSAGVPPLERYRAAFNWEKRVKATGGLVPSELVTGSMALFAGQLFFATFISVTGADACDLGKGRVFAVDYVARDNTDVNQTGSTPITTYGPLPIGDAAADADSTSIVNVSAANAVDNLLILGLSVAQRPSCSVVDATSFDAFGEYLSAIGEVSPPELVLVAQGGGQDTSLLSASSGGRLKGLDLKLRAPRTNARVLSWATSVD